MGAFVRRRDVGHVGRRCREGGPGNARDDASDEEVPDEWRDRHHEVVEGQPQQRQEKHRPAPVAVRQIAQDRRKHELHESVSEDEIAADNRRVGDAAPRQVLKQFWEDRDDDADADHVDQDGGENAHQGQSGSRSGLHAVVRTFSWGAGLGRN